MGAPGPKGDPGAAGTLDLRVLVDQSKAMCDASEFMISAYCADGIGNLHVFGTAGASCDGDPARKRWWFAQDDKAARPRNFSVQTNGQQRRSRIRQSVDDVKVMPAAFRRPRARPGFGQELSLPEKCRSFLGANPDMGLNFRTQGELGQGSRLLFPPHRAAGRRSSPSERLAPDRQAARSARPA